MKKLDIVLAFTVFATITSCNYSGTNNSNASSTDSITSTADTTQTFTLDTNKLASEAIFYQCEMHADVNSDKPGSCPQCGMDLSEMKKH